MLSGIGFFKTSASKPKPNLCNNWQSSASLFWCQAPIWGPWSEFYYCQLWVCGSRAPSLTRGQVSSLQFLLVLTSAISLSPCSARFTTVFFCLRFKTPLTWMAMPPYLHLPGKMLPSYNRRYRVPFSLPLTTHRAMVEVFKLPPHCELQKTLLPITPLFLRA
jgi:hypothetical protein